MAAASSQIYALMYFVGNGTLFVEETKFDFRRTAGAQRVMTVAKGFAGLSPGAQLFEFDVTEAIPSAGLEFDMGRYIAGNIPIDVQAWIGTGGKIAKGKAFIEHDSGSHAVDTPSQYMFSGVMGLQLFT